MIEFKNLGRVFTGGQELSKLYDNQGRLIWQRDLTLWVGSASLDQQTVYTYKDPCPEDAAGIAIVVNTSLKQGMGIVTSGELLLDNVPVGTVGVASGVLTYKVPKAYFNKPLLFRANNIQILGVGMNNLITPTNATLMLSVYALWSGLKATLIKIYPYY